KKRPGEAPRHFPVIVLTADVQMAQREVYLRHGFDECLLKPVTMGKFKRLLIRWGLLTEEEAGDDLPARAIKRPTGEKEPAIDRAAMVEQLGAFDDMAIEMLEMFVEMTRP